MLQGQLFMPESSWSPPRLSELPQDWNVTPRLGLDTETCDPLLKKLGPGVRRGGYIAGISFAFDEGGAWYLPLRHLGGDNMDDPGRALDYVRYQAYNYRGEIVGAKLSYDLDYLEEAGIVFPLATFRDVQVAEPLIDELQFSYSLDACLARHGLPLKDESLLRDAAAQYKIDPKAEMYKLPARFVGPYASVDAVRPLQLYAKQEVILQEQNLTRVWELECAVLPILVKMRRRGVAVDADELDRVERWAAAEEMKAWGEVGRLSGVYIKNGDGMKPLVVSKALEAVDITPPRTAKGAPSITAPWLEALKHPAAAAIRQARKYSTLQTTFVASVRAHSINGRIHTTFNQIVFQKDEDGGSDTEGAAYGRLSSVDPNLQQQPGMKDPKIGKPWRKIYVPEPGTTWGQLDYSQQEPRLALHFAVASGPSRIGEGAYKNALEAAQRYKDDPSTDSHTMFTKMVYGEGVTGDTDFKVKRDDCKQTFLGICYGMGGPKLCRKIGKPTKIIAHYKTGRRMEVAGDEGQALLDLVDTRVPYIRKTAKAVEEAAKERGYIITVKGRRLHFPQDANGNYDWTHKAFNRAIQGSAADQTKQAMVELDRAGAWLQLQVHDEFDLSLANKGEGERYARIMEECVLLHVPSKVDVGIGRSWGEVEE